MVERSLWSAELEEDCRMRYSSKGRIVLSSCPTKRLRTQGQLVHRLRYGIRCTHLEHVQVQHAQETKRIALLAVDLDTAPNAIPLARSQHGLPNRMEIEQVRVSVEELAEETLEGNEVDVRVGREEVKVDVDEGGRRRAGGGGVGLGVRGGVLVHGGGFGGAFALGSHVGEKLDRVASQASQG
jgi:hypothetical protein